MATVSTEGDPLAVATWQLDGDAPSKSHRYLAKRLAAAGAEVKGAALSTFFLSASVAAMLWLAAGVLVEHWVVPGGLPVSVRWMWLGAGLAALVVAVIRWVVPLLRYRVNLVYAARMLEQEHPELHNDVVNAVLVQAHADEAAPLIVKSLRRRAARQLSAVPGAGVVDRTVSLRLVYALAALIVAGCLYELFAPKSLLVSAARLMVPWMSVTAPSRVRIEPPVLTWRAADNRSDAADAGHPLPLVHGTASLVRGRQLVVTTSIEGLRSGEKPELIVTPRSDGEGDASTSSWRLPLMPAGDRRMAAIVPGADRGLDQPVDLVVAAGDARSDRIRIVVVDQPAVLVREVHYRYPDYTGQPPESIPWQGDVRGIEGTHVAVVVESNHPLEAAWIDLDADGKKDLRMTIGQQDLARARGEFTLRLLADRSAAEHARYRIVFQPKSASAAQQEPSIDDKMEYRIEVLPDLAPEVMIEEPSDKVTRVPPDAPVAIRVRAVDPDHGLSSVTLETRIAPGSEQTGPELLVGRRKTFRGAATLVPMAMGAGPGATLEYRAIAKDNRAASPNVAATAWQALKIDPSAPPRPMPPPERSPDGEEGERGGPSDDGTGDDRPQDQGQRPDQAPDESRSGSPDGGRDGGQDQSAQPKSQQKDDPNNGARQGAPQQGEDQGSGEGAKTQDDARGKTGNQQGRQPQQGQPEAGGSEQEGQGGTEQAGSGQGGEGSKGKKASGDAAGDAGDGRQAGARDGGASGESRPGDSGTPGGAQAGRDQGERGGQPGERDGQSGREQQAGKGAGGGGPSQRPRDTVAADGTDDGEAMERILDHRDRTEGQGSKGSSKDKGQGRGSPPDQKGKSDGEASRDDQHDHADGEPPACAGPDGKPCGKEGCSSCGGGQSSGGAGGSSSGGGSESSPSGAGQGGEKGGSTGGDQAGQRGAGEGATSAERPAHTADHGDETTGAAASPQTGQGAGESSDPSAGQPGSEKPGASPRDSAGASEGSTGEGKGTGEGRGSSGEPKGDQAGGQGADGGEPGAQGDAAQAGRDGAGEGKGESSTAGSQRGASGGDQAGGASRDTGASNKTGDAGQASPGSDVGAGGFDGGGDVAGGAGDASRPREDREMEWGEQDLAHARNAADLAIEHLRHAVDSGDTSVLDELGWTPEQARQFLARWEAMRRLAGSADPRQRGEFERTLQSLGLRPNRVQSSRRVEPDTRGGQAESRRTRPPSDYREQFKAFMQGTSAE